MQNQQPILLITGVSGRIGQALARRAAGTYRILGLTHRQPSGEFPHGECLQVDFGSEQRLRGLGEEIARRFGERIASLVHLAAFYDFSGEDDPRYREVNVEGSERLLRVLGRTLRLEQFLFSSTMLVHPPCRPGERITEDWPLEPHWPYPRSKAEAEVRLRASRGATPLVLARICSVYDEWCRHPVLAQQIRRVYEREPVAHLFPGDPEHGTTYLHLEDLVDALLAAVERRQSLPAETAVLLGEPEPVSYREVQETTGCRLHGEEWSTLRIPQPVARAGAWVQEQLGVGDPFIKPWMIPMADEHYAVDPTRARELLGWTPRHRMGDVLPEMLANLKADPERWYRENGLELPAS